MLEDEKAKKEDRPSSSSLKSFGDNPDEEEPSDDLSKPRKVHYYSKWKNTQDAVYWVNLARAHDKGLRFWQTRSQVVDVDNSVPTGYIYKVISHKGERTPFERFSTFRPPRMIVLKSTWQSQQQQQQDISESTSSELQESGAESAESPVHKEEPEFEVDLRIEGIEQDVILKDEKRMGKSKRSGGKLRNDSRTKSIFWKIWENQKTLWNSARNQVI